MKFAAGSTDLQRTLSKLSGVLPSRSTMPILENILFDLTGNNLTMTATDLSLTLTVGMEVQGIEDGKVAVPAKRLVDTIRSLPDINATFSVDSGADRVMISTSNGEYTLVGESAKDYPQVPPFQAAGSLEFETDVLRGIIYRTVFAVSSDELRPAMMGVLFQSYEGALRVVSTDGHRLVRLVYQGVDLTALKKDIIIPAKALSVLARSTDGRKIDCSFSTTHARFEFENSVLVTRLIDETYPNYESVIPAENDKTLRIDREQLIGAIRRVALYASAATHQVRLTVSPASLVITAQDVDFGGEAKENVSCEYSAEEMDIGFNSVYLTDILSHLEGSEVQIKFSSPTRAAIVAPVEGAGEEDVLMLVMPVRLNT
ncbi:MAG: DNA polymerase III subunit beta [Bacteroidota bacterium]